jgi:TolB-like protein/Flp pilus assembly protein TadD
MAAEAVRGEPVDERSDLWSLGVVLHEMATGRLPFQGASAVEMIAAVLHQPPEPLPPGVEPRLADLITRCLQKDPARRPPDAATVLAGLEAIRSGAADAPRKARATPPLVVVGLGLAALAVSGYALSVLLSAPTSLAVLPLENLSADPAQSYFADGVTEELIGDLGQIADLRVISRNSVMRYLGSDRALPAIARDLGVGYLVTGSVRSGGDSVRIRAQLSRVSPERVLWSAGYTRSAREVLALQSEVAQDIARKISVRITPLEHSRLASSKAVRPEAYEEYLRGRAAWNQRTPEGMQEAVTRFEHAVTLDPGLALAYAGLADAYARLSLYTGRPPRETYPAASAAAGAALRLDDGLAEAHTSLAGVALFYDHDWSRAQAEFLRAIALRPSYPTAHHWYSIWLRDRGRFTEALVEAGRAVAVDPHSPILRVNLADTHFYARDFAQAILLHRRAIAADSAFAPAWLYLGMACDQARQSPAAVAAVTRAWELSGRRTYALGPLGYVEGRAGHVASARRARDRLAALADSGFAVALDVALIEVGLGERAEAMRWLERAEQERAALNELGVDPRFDPLRAMPAFRALLERLGLAEDQKRT